MRYWYYLLATWSAIAVMVSLMQSAGLPYAAKVAIWLFIAGTAILTWILKDEYPSGRSRVVLAVWGSGITALTAIDMLLHVRPMLLSGSWVMSPYIAGNMAVSHIIVIISWYGAHAGMSSGRRWLGRTVAIFCLLAGCLSFATKPFDAWYNS